MIKNFYFFTATVLQWKHVLKFDKYKDIIIESFQFLVKSKRVRIFAFVIMPNHYHAVWKINSSLEKSDFQRDSMKYTGQMILRDLKKNHGEIHKSMYVGAKDRTYQFWERNPLSIPLYSQKVVEQKINYFHANPLIPDGILPMSLKTINILQPDFITQKRTSLIFWITIWKF